MLTELLKNSLLEAGVPERHFSILDKGMPYVTRTRDRILIIKDNKLETVPCNSKASVVSGLLDFRSSGVPLSKVALRFLYAGDVKLSKDELHRMGKMKWPKRRRR